MAFIGLLFAVSKNQSFSGLSKGFVSPVVDQRIKPRVAKPQYIKICERIPIPRLRNQWVKSYVRWEPCHRYRTSDNQKCDEAGRVRLRRSNPPQLQLYAGLEVEQSTAV